MRRIRKETGDESGSAPGITTRERSNRTSEDSKRTLLCAGCRHPITHENDAVGRPRLAESSAQHQHTCVNPAGVVFQIRCFSHAPGCFGQGEVTDAFSWFAGYAWQIALCEKCAMHLGWLFTGSAPAFCGLIDDRIVLGDG